jgi:hypothetical protein
MPEALAVMLEKLDVLKALLHGYDWSNFRTGGHKSLAGAGDHVLGLPPSKPEVSAMARSALLIMRWPWVKPSACAAPG